MTDSRQYTMGGAGAIPHSEVSDYLNEKHVFDPDDRNAIRYLIKKMDQRFLNPEEKAQPNAEQ